MKKLVVAVFVVSAVLPSMAGAQGRFKLSLSGAFSATRLDYDGARVFPEFLEVARVFTNYSADTAPGFEVGVQFNFTSSLGVAASVGVFSRDAAGQLNASLPHPFFFNQDRALNGNVDALDLKETVGHLDLVYVLSSGSLDVSLFGGVSLFKAEAELVTRVDYSQVYPFDEATLTGTPTDTFDDSPVGYNVGFGLDYSLNQRIALGALVRFARASATFGPDADNQAEVDLGGVQVAGGIRIIF